MTFSQKIGTQNRLNKLNKGNSKSPNTGKNISDFVPSTPNMRDSSRNMTTKILQGFSNRILKSLWGLRCIREPSNCIKWVKFQNEAKVRRPMRGRNNKDTFSNSKNLDVDNGVSWNFLPPEEKKIAQVVSENPTNTTRHRNRREGIVHIDFDCPMSRRRPHNIRSEGAEDKRIITPPGLLHISVTDNKLTLQAFPDH